MQLLAEAPAVAADAGDGVVAEVELVQGCEAVERAAVHLHQAVVFQVPATTATRSPWPEQGAGAQDSMTVHKGVCACAHVCTRVCRQDRQTQTDGECPGQVQNQAHKWADELHTEGRAYERKTVQRKPWGQTPWI